VLPPARTSIHSASGGLPGLGCVGERIFSVRQCRLGLLPAGSASFFAPGGRRITGGEVGWRRFAWWCSIGLGGIRKGDLASSVRNKVLQVSPPFAVISDAGDGSVSLVFVGGVRWRESALLSWNNFLGAFLSFVVVCFGVGVGSVSCFYLVKGRKLNSPAMGSRSGLSTTSAAVDSFSGRRSYGRWRRICSSPSLVAVWPAASDFMMLCSSGGDGRCALEAVYSATSPSSKSSYAVSSTWTSSVQHMVATRSTPAAYSNLTSGRWREDPGSGVCNFQICQRLFCIRVGMYCSYLI
jgi:hypothetical protein